MSSRVLKKLQGGTEKDLDFITPAAADEDEQSSGDEENIKQSQPGSKSKHLNPFDLLHQSFSESEFKEDDNETEHASTAANCNSSTTTSKKKKRRRKKKTKHTGNYISSEDNEVQFLEKQIASINSAIRKDITDHQHQNADTSPREIDKSILVVELKHLNPQNEMRRTFGKRVVKIENKRGRLKHTLKTTYLVTPKEHWPPIMKNVIAMKPVGPPDNLLAATVGSSTSSATASVSASASVAPSVVRPSSGKEQWFAFEHSEFYQNMQNLFLPAVERTDSDFLINLIRRCPYHVDSLIQMSELCKMTESYALASELLERAVFVLEAALHPSFSLTSGSSRLDYRRQENRAFFIVLFKHAQYLEGRACSRTALELAKLIMSFNPEDPLAMVLIIDYYALRSKQYAWLIKFYDEYDAIRNLSQLPSMAYSYALALFLVHGQCEQSDKALQYALLMFPGVLRPLLDEMSVQTDQRVVGSSYFNSEVSSNQSPALHQLVCLYVCRAKVVWRQNQVLPWMERNVNEVLDRIDKKDEILTEYNQKRTARYVTPPRPILRHVILSDFKEKVPLSAFIAKEKDSIVTYDPLPPHDSINFYERKSSSSSPTTASGRPVSMFFQSLLPSFMLNRPDGGNFNPDAGVQRRIVAIDAGDINAAAPLHGVRQAVAGRNALGNAAQGVAAAINNALQGAFGGAGPPEEDAVENGAGGGAGGAMGGGAGSAAAVPPAAAAPANDIDGSNLQNNDANSNTEQIIARAVQRVYENQLEDGEQADEASRLAFSDSIAGIVDVLRDFLHNFDLGDGNQATGGDGDADENNSSEDDTSDYM